MHIRSLTFALLATCHCGVSVVPADGDSADVVLSDRNVPDSDAPDRDASAADRDAEMPRDARDLRRPSYILMSNRGGTRVTGRFSARQPRPDGSAETVGGCRLFEAHRLNLVFAGTMRVEYPSVSREIPWRLTNTDEYYDALMSEGLAVGARFVTRLSGSAEFPAFEIAGEMPESMPTITQPAVSPIPLDPSQPLIIRWTPAASDDLVRATIFGINAARNVASVDCIGVVRRGTLAIPPEALRVLVDYPLSRTLGVARLREYRTTVEDAPIVLAMSNFPMMGFGFR
jgi:hypothetical protein